MDSISGSPFPRHVIVPHPHFCFMYTSAVCVRAIDPVYACASFSRSFASTLASIAATRSGAMPSFSPTCSRL